MGFSYNVRHTIGGWGTRELMIIIALADIHGKLGYLSEVANDLRGADLVLIAGDITNFGNKADAQMILSQLRQYNTNILAVSGNCDPVGVDKYLSDEGINISRNCIEKDGICFVGLGGSLPCYGLTPNEMPEQRFCESMASVESTLASGRFIFVSHQPAWGCRVDHCGNNHSGSEAIRSFIEKNKPMIAVSGHIHEAVGVDRIGETTVVNPGPFRDGSYAYIMVDTEVRQVAIRSAYENINSSM